MALARVAPPSTVVRTPTSVFWNAGFSWLAARISRHCTSGKPASIMTENWRKKIAISLTLTLLDPKVGMTNSLPFSDRTGSNMLTPQRLAQSLLVWCYALSGNFLSGGILAGKCENWHGFSLSSVFVLIAE